VATTFLLKNGPVKSRCHYGSGLISWTARDCEKDVAKTRGSRHGKRSLQRTGGEGGKKRFEGLYIPGIGENRDPRFSWKAHDY